MAISASTRGGVQSEINVTPLVDVVLVLLIIFMVVTPILQMGLDVEVPPKVEVTGPVPPSALTQLVITVHGDSFMLNQERFTDVNALRNRIASSLNGRATKDKVVFINSDDQVAFDRAVQAMDAARQGGADKIGFLTETPK